MSSSYSEDDSALASYFNPWFISFMYWLPTPELLSPAAALSADYALAITASAFGPGEVGDTGNKSFAFFTSELN